MWSAVPDIDDLSSGSGSDGEKSAKSEDAVSCDNRDAEASNGSCNNSNIAPPRGVSNQHWQTFYKLKRRREESKQSHFQNRPKKQRKKHRALVDQEDACSPDTAQPSSSSASSPPQGAGESKLPNLESPEKKSTPTPEQQEHWDNLKKHLNVNDHIYQGIDHGQYNRHKSGLEKQVDKAVEEGSFEEAEKLSDQLATRDLACKIAKSVDARDYLKWKEGEEAKRKARKRKKKLNWVFEAKERWQMKGNM